MSETTPNAKGPAPVQVPAKQAQVGWVTVHAGMKSAEGTAVELIPSADVKPEDIAALSIEYRDGQPVVVISGGTAIPAELTLVDESSRKVGKYNVAPFALFEIPRDDSPQRR